MIKILRLGLLLLLLAVTSYYAFLHWRVLHIGHPVTQDEPGFIEITAAAHPYSFDGVVAGGNVYGPGYPHWARLFTAEIDNPYLAHRWASTIALFALLALLACVLRREGVGGIEAAVGVGVVYILNVSSHSMSANADLLGAALYFSALAVSRRGTWPALLGGLALTALAAFTKPYFAFAWIIVVTHLLLFAPPRRALAFLGYSAVLAAMTAAVILAVTPYYFFSTFLLHGGVAVRDVHHLLAQTGEFALLTCGIVLLALLARPRNRTLAFSWHRPLLEPPVDFWAWSSLLAALVLLGSLGWHPGNYLVYYFHLLLPPLVIVALRRVPAWPRLSRALLAANLFVLGWLAPAPPGDDHWETLAASVGTVRGPVLADPLLEPFTRSQPNVELVSHACFANILQLLDQVEPKDPSPAAAIHREMLRRTEATSARIRAHEFAAVYTAYVDLGDHLAWAYEPRHIQTTLSENYHKVGEVRVFLYATPYWNRMQHGQFAYHVVMWLPNPPAAPAAPAEKKP